MEYDLSEGKFYAKWPDWLRWTLLLPSSVAGALVVSTLFNVLTSLFTDSNNSTLDHGWYNLISSGLLGAAFVGIAAYVAPRKQFEVCVIMLVVISIAMGMLWVREYDLGYFIQTKDMLYYTMHFLASIIGGGIATFAVKEEIENHSS